MRTSELHYELPAELIAAMPAERRDASRLLVLDRRTGGLRHERFARLPDLLPPGALLVFNDTRVLPARLELMRATGGRLEGLFLCEPEPGLWEVMMTGSGRVRAGETLSIAGSAQKLVLVARVDGGAWHVRPDPPGAAIEILNRWGAPPLPPYILRQRATRDADGGAERRREGERERRGEEGHDPQSGIRESSGHDAERYQTVYAREPGAVAAPTAGLHFTPELLDTLRARGFETHFVTLHVGVGTFAPIRVENLADHVMHAEWYHCPPAVADAVNAARAAGRPVVAVGTTSVRVLETCARQNETCEVRSENAQPPDVSPLTSRFSPGPPSIRSGAGWTHLFIYPPYAFKVVDAMITNFHLPQSTLLAMVFAFAGRDRVLAAYQEAIRERYRFYSYGDAMLIES
jgi:S-adenosylmethionine:tRNA ribosyltransferase-isomerase